MTPSVFRAIVLAKALELYANTGVKANTAYTPSAMLRTANNITGHVYRRGQYLAAAAGLREWAQASIELHD